MARTGRPTILNDELIASADEYLLTCNSIGVHQLLPTIEGLALHLHCHRDSLYRWAEENTDFYDILEELKQLQAQKLMQNGLQNRYNPTITKLMLSKHGYIEQRQDDITSGGEKLGVELSANQAAQLIKARSTR